MTRWLDALTRFEYLVLFGLCWLALAIILGALLCAIWPGDDDLDEGDFKWCEPCRSYHHPDNPTCLRSRAN